MKAHIGKRGIRALSVSLAALLTASLLVMAPAPGNFASAKNAQVQRYEDQISDLERTQKELQDKIARVKDEAAQTAEYKQNLDSLVYTLSQ